MLVFEEAYEIVITQATRVGSERIPLHNALNRVLAEDILSDLDMPPFDKSAVDGFAYRRTEASPAGLMSQDSIDKPGGPSTDCSTGRTTSDCSYRILETVPAGTVPVKTVGVGECSRIMTGAMVPPGADAVMMVEDTVMMVEDTELLPQEHVRFIKERSANNICYRGEDIKKDDQVLAAGEQIGPAHMATLAAVGATEPLVSLLPRVAVISTGDELVEPDRKPLGAQIRNSNAIQLMAQLMQVPASPYYMGIASDTGDSIRTVIDNALKENDMVLLTGGVSMGDFDFVPDVMQEAGVEILFKSVAIQPGRPTVFGRKGDKLLFGLPGNPVSSFVLFEMMVKPALLKMMGHTGLPRLLSLPMGQDFTRRRSERKSLIPVRIDNGEIRLVDYHGSAHINAYTAAQAILLLDIGVTEIKTGEKASVRLL